MIGLNTKDQQEPVKDTRTKDEDSQEFDEIPKGRTFSTGTTQILMAAAIVVVVVVIAFFLFRGNNNQVDELEVATSTTSSEAVVTPDPETEVEDDGVTVESGDYVDEEDDSQSAVKGDPDYEDSSNNTITEKYYDASDYIKDLQGEDVSAVYTVASRSYVKKHVPYVAKRATVADGMEMYWLEVTYEKKVYRVQCSYYHFKDLEEEGVCRVEIEVLNLEGGGQIISYMQVIDEDD